MRPQHARSTDAKWRILSRPKPFGSKTSPAITTIDLAAHLLDRDSLDALAYPTMLQEPALIGAPTGGGTCSLSANSGLPALSVLAGFTENLLPVAVELLGRAFDDSRLVALAYASEGASPRRRAPLQTPPLVDGRAPGPVVFAVAAGSVAGRGREGAGLEGVVERLSPPGAGAAEGVLELPAHLLHDLVEGNLELGLYTRRAPLGAARARLEPPTP